MAHTYTHEQMTGWFTRLSPAYQAHMLGIAESMPQWPVTIPQPEAAPAAPRLAPTERRYIKDGWVWVELVEANGSVSGPFKIQAVQEQGAASGGARVSSMG